MEEPRKKGRALLDELLSHVTDENLHGETDWGPAVGREMLPPYVEMKEQIVAWLREHAERHDLKKRALESCRKYLQACNPPGVYAGRLQELGITITELNIEWTHHALLFEERAGQTPRVVTYIIFGFRSRADSGADYLGIEPFGFYELETRLDGEHLEDWYGWHRPDASKDQGR